MRFLILLAFWGAVTNLCAQTVSDIPYRSAKSLTGNAQVVLKLDLYLPPKSSPSSFPVLVLCHGGSYVAGDKRDVQPFAESISKLGVAVVAVNYRLGIAPNATNEVEAASGVFEDMLGCFGWVAENSSKYHLDAQRVFIGGGSSGGHISLATGILYPYESRRKVRLLGVLDFFGGYFTEKISRNSTDLIIFQGTADQACLPEASRKMAALYRSNGAKCSLQIFEGMYHSWEGEWMPRLALLSAQFIQTQSQGSAEKHLWADRIWSEKEVSLP